MEFKAEIQSVFDFSDVACEDGKSLVCYGINKFSILLGRKMLLSNQ